MAKSIVFKASKARSEILVTQAKILSAVFLVAILAMFIFDGPKAGTLLLFLALLFSIAMVFAMKKYSVSIAHEMTLSKDGILYEPLIKWIGVSFIPWGEIIDYQKKQIDYRWFVRLYIREGAYKNNTHNYRLRKFSVGDSILIPLDHLECNVEELYEAIKAFMHN